MVLIVGLTLAGIAYLVYFYFDGKSSKNRKMQILQRLDRHDHTIVAICMKVLSSFSHHPFSSQLLENNHTANGTAILFRKVEEIRKTYKKIRGCLIRLLPEHPEYGDYTRDIGNAKKHLRETELNIGLLSQCVHDLRIDALAYLEPPKSFLEMCDREIRHLEEARTLAIECADDLDELEALMSSKGHARIEEAAN